MVKYARCSCIQHPADQKLVNISGEIEGKYQWRAVVVEASMPSSGIYGNCASVGFKTAAVLHVWVSEESWNGGQMSITAVASLLADL